MSELQQILDELNIKATVLDKIEGTRITAYYISFNYGVKTLPTKNSLSLIQVRLGGNSIRLIEIPERNCFALEISYANSNLVEMRDLIISDAFKTSRLKYKFIVGKKPNGEIVIGSLPESKNILIAGQSGSGKSVGINVIIASLLQESPKDLKFIMIDPKRVELTGYNGIPHLLAPIITEQDKALVALRWVDEQIRYRNAVLEKIGEKMKGSAFKNIVEYNNRLNRIAVGARYLFTEHPVHEVDKLLELIEFRENLKINGLIKEYEETGKILDDMYRCREFETRKSGIDVDEFRRAGVEYENMKLPRIVIVIDELGDLIMNSKGKEIQNLIVKICQLGRASGIHLIVATQRPSADILSPLIKANLQTKIAYAVSTASNSRIILDENGAEKLLGKGDMLYKQADDMTATRVQGAFISSDEIDKMLNFIKSNNSSPVFNEKLMKMLDVRRCSEDRIYRHFTPYVPPRQWANQTKSLTKKNDGEDEAFNELYVIDHFVNGDD